MPSTETLNSQEHPLAQDTIEALRDYDEQSREILAERMAAIVLLVLIRKHFSHLNSEGHFNKFIDEDEMPEATEETNRERWARLLHGTDYDWDDSDRYDNPWIIYTHSKPANDFSYHTDFSFRNPQHRDYFSYRAPGSQRAETAENVPPPLPFEVVPASMQPNAEERAGAMRANELLRAQLVEQGWESGKPTPDQLKKATRNTLSNLHPDQNSDISAADAEAGKLISGQMKEIRKGLFGEEKVQSASTQPAPESTPPPSTAESTPPPPKAPPKESATPPSASSSADSASSGAGAAAA